MPDDLIVPGSDRVVVVEQSPEVAHVEREHPAQETHETTIIRGDDRGGLSPSMLLTLVLCFLLAAALIYTMATSRDDKSATDGLNLTVDVAAPQLPTVSVPAVDVNVRTPDVALPDVQSQTPDAPTAKTDTAIAPGEPLELVESAKAE